MLNFDGVIGSWKGEFLQSHGPSERVKKLPGVFDISKNTRVFVNGWMALNQWTKAQVTVPYGRGLLRFGPPKGMFGLPWDKWVGKKRCWKAYSPSIPNIDTQNTRVWKEIHFGICVKIGGCNWNSVREGFEAFKCGSTDGTWWQFQICQSFST